MKQIVLLLLLSPLSLFSQFDSTQFSFTLVDSTKESKEQLFVKAKSWFANAFNSSKDVIQMEDKESGTIIGKSIMVYDDKNASYVVHMSVKFTLTVNVRENKYRLVLSDFINDGYIDDPAKRINGSGLGFSDVKFSELPYSVWVKRDISKKAKEIVESFRTEMRKPAKSDNF